MRATLLAVAATALLTAAIPASTASAQGVSVQAPGVGVRIGEPDRWRERRWHDEDRYSYRYRDRATVGGPGCRTVTVRERLPDGSMMVRRRSSC